MDTTIKTQTRLAPVKQFQCPSCGNSLEVVNPRAKFVGCKYCGSYLDAASEEHKILKKLAEPGRYKPLSFIRLGQIATLSGKQYQVIARTRWLMDYKEYWSEEGESGYSDERWTYDEWLLISEDRTYLYLVEDQEGYSFSEEIIPELPTLLPRNLRMRFYENQSNSIVREYGKAMVSYFEGESNYHIRLADEIRFASFKQGQADYLVEWRMEGKSDDIKEVEFFKETPVRRWTLVEAFDDNEEVARMKEVESKWRFVNRVAWVGALVMLLLFLASLGSEGETVFSESYTISGVSSTQPAVSFPVAGPIEIEGGVPTRICLEASNMPNSTEFFAFVYVMDADSALINTVDGEFSYYTGYEDGEQWTEAEMEANKIFRLKETGTYYLQAHVESEIANAGILRVSVQQGVMLTRYYVMGLLACLVIVFYAWMKKSQAGSMV